MKGARISPAGHSVYCTAQLQTAVRSAQGTKIQALVLKSISFILIPRKSPQRYKYKDVCVREGEGGQYAYILLS